MLLCFASSVKHSWKGVSFIAQNVVWNLIEREVIITKYFEKGYHYLKMSFIIRTQFLKVSFCNFELTARLQHSFSSMCHLQWFFTRLRSCCKRAMDWKPVGFQLSISIDVPTVVTVRAGHWHIVSSSSQTTLHNAPWPRMPHCAIPVQTATSIQFLLYSPSHEFFIYVHPFPGQTILLKPCLEFSIWCLSAMELR